MASGIENIHEIPIVGAMPVIPARVLSGQKLSYDGVGVSESGVGTTTFVGAKADLYLPNDGAAPQTFTIEIAYRPVFTAGEFDSILSGWHTLTTVNVAPAAVGYYKILAAGYAVRVKGSVPVQAFDSYLWVSN